MSKLKLLTALDYNNGENVIKPNQFRISASGISRFFTNTNQWWRENFLNESGFISSTASVLGTCVHYCAECYAKNKTISKENQLEINNYILKHTEPAYEDYNEEISLEVIESQYKVMAMNLINNELQSHMPSLVEPFIAHEVLPNIFVGGSIDALEGVILDDNGNFKQIGPALINDYKTTSLTPARIPKVLKYEYKLQLLTYAWVLKQKGITVDRIKNTYITRQDINRIGKTGRPLKDYPSEIITIIENITDESIEYIDGIIRVIASSVDHWDKYPEHRYLLAQDWRLHPDYKQPTKPTSAELFG